MNKQMTLEEINDAKAYPAKVYRKPISEGGMIEAMRELARLESRRVGGVRYQPRAGLSKDQKNRNERTLAALEGGPMNRKQLAFALGISYNSVTNYLRPLLKDGRVVRVGTGVKIELFALPNCPQIKRQHVAGNQYIYWPK